MTEWYRETLHRDFAQSYAMDRIVFREQTAHQDLVIFENRTFGTVMALDGAIQTTTADEFIYHEMIVHVPVLAHGGVRRVLIVGGGDGGALRRCLMHSGVERVVMVEIDRTVVDLSLKYLPSISAGAFDDKRGELVIADGCRFVAETDERFDLVIVDSTDPQGPGAVLFTPEFYADCKRCFAPGGVLVCQAGVPFLQGDELAGIAANLRRSFADVWAYGAAVPTYVGGDMALGWATDDAALRRQTAEAIRPRFEAARLEARYYTPERHAAAFALPAFVEALVAGRR